MNKKILKISLVVIFIIVSFLFIFFNFVTYNMKIVVTDAITGKPIDNLPIYFATRKMAHDPLMGTDYSVHIEDKKFKTNENGELIIAVKRSISSKKASMFAVNGDDNVIFSLTPFDDGYMSSEFFADYYNRSPGYFPIKYILCNSEKNVFCGYENSSLIKFERSNTEEILIQLIPRINFFDQCKKIDDTKLQDNCFTFNAYSNAIKNKEAPLCNYIKEERIKKRCESDLITLTQLKQQEVEQQATKKCLQWEGQTPENVVTCFYANLINNVKKSRKISDTNALPGYSSNDKYINKEFLDNNTKFYNSLYFKEKVSNSEKSMGYIHSFCSSAIPERIEIKNSKISDSTSEVYIDELFSKKSPVSIKTSLTLIDNKWTITNVLCP